MVAEDEEDVRNMLSKIPQNKGYRVITASDGENAVSVFQAHMDQIDLVILDLVMPKLSGRKVFEKIRAIRPNVPALFSTGYTTGAADAEFLSRSDWALIQKPYSPSVLYAAVRELLRQQSA